VASGDGVDGSLRWGQDVRRYASLLSAGGTVTLELGTDRHAWVQVVQGDLDLGGQVLRGGDGAAVSNESKLLFKAVGDSEFLVFDLP
jgi:redox-sensitive bicupin YhaK (pirin superfamily)